MDFPEKSSFSLKFLEIRRVIIRRKTHIAENSFEINRAELDGHLQTGKSLKFQRKRYFRRGILRKYVGNQVFVKSLRGVFQLFALFAGDFLENCAEIA